MDDDPIEINEEEIEGESSGTVTKSKRTDAVWQFFEIDKEKREWNCNICKHPRKFKYTTECPSTTLAKRHLKSLHAKESKFIEEKEKSEGAKIKKKTLDPKQPKLSFAPEKKYAADHWKQKKFNKSLVLYAANPSISIYQIKSDGFKALIGVTDPQIKIPADYKAIKSMICDFFNKEKAHICQKLQKLIPKYNAMLDIWSDANVRTSYLGVSIQFYNGETNALERIFLEMRPLLTSHTGRYIRGVFLSILSEFDLPEENLLKIISDNASNMISAFPNESHNSDDESGSDSERDEANVRNQYGFEEEADEFSDFEERTENKRFGCIAHSLNLALMVIMKKHVMAIDGFSHFKKLITHFNKSHESKKKLIEATGGLSLLKLCGTRWAQWLISLERFLKIKEHLKKIVRAKPNLSFPDFPEIAQFESIVVFLKPIVELLTPIQAEKSVTISMVFPRLKIFLQEATKNDYPENEFMQLVRNDFVAQIRMRFSFLLDTTDAKYDKSFLLATLLDPNYCWLMEWRDEYTAKGLFKLLVKNNPQVQKQPNPIDQNEYDKSGENENLSAFERMKAEKRKSIANASANQAEMSAEEEALEAYLAWAKMAVPDSVNPIEFWSNADPRWKVLSEVALQILSVPATSAAQERIFSYAGIATEKRRSRIGSELLNHKLFIHLNKSSFT